MELAYGGWHVYGVDLLPSPGRSKNRFETTRMPSYTGPGSIAMGENHHFSIDNKVETGE